MVGECPNCGREFIRPADCDVAACDCESAREVPLYPTLVLPTRMYNEFKKIADREKIPLETLVNMVLELAIEYVEDTWKRG